MAMKRDDAPMQHWRSPAYLGLLAYCTTSLLVALGAWVGFRFLPAGDSRKPEKEGFIEAFSAWDGNWYTRISTDGYIVEGQETSRRLAFFPLYPLLGRLAQKITGFQPYASLLFISQFCLVLAFIMAASYTTSRFGTDKAALTEYVVFSLGLFPPTLFMRMAYTESLFLLFVLLTLYAMEHKWPIASIAIVIAVGTSARFVGLGLVPVLGYYIWQQGFPVKRRIIWTVFAIPMSTLGIACFVLYQWYYLDSPLAFLKAQSFWTLRPSEGFEDKVVSLITFEPIWSTYIPSSPGYWGRHNTHLGILNYSAAEPLYFVGSVAVLTLGACKGWINRRESLMSFSLLAIAYCGRAFDMYMTSSARFVSIVFPVYLVLGIIFSQMGRFLSLGCLTVFAFWLTVYSALHVSWYRVL